ncbi:hypothetical protein VP01_3100g1 [Puccinia sorghi]|uniref:Uncharacterized protein n=1 Tax=Puccinia sorghi TaxID=27349 RepID=A0A0L6V1A0_9BASI|nr:hypothetical protein VP01_3100g1 [Puccinia sorghi]
MKICRLSESTRSNPRRCSICRHSNGNYVVNPILTRLHALASPQVVAALPLFAGVGSPFHAAKAMLTAPSLGLTYKPGFILPKPFQIPSKRGFKHTKVSMFDMFDIMGPIFNKPLRIFFVKLFKNSKALSKLVQKLGVLINTSRSNSQGIKIELSGQTDRKIHHPRKKCFPPSQLNTYPIMRNLSIQLAGSCGWRIQSGPLPELRIPHSGKQDDCSSCNLHTTRTLTHQNQPPLQEQALTQSLQSLRFVVMSSLAVKVVVEVVSRSHLGRGGHQIWTVHALITNTLKDKNFKLNYFLSSNHLQGESERFWEKKQNSKPGVELGPMCSTCPEAKGPPMSKSHLI